MQIAGPGIDHVGPWAVNAIEKCAGINELPACFLVELIHGLLRKSVFRVIGKAQFHLKGLALLLGLEIKPDLVDRIVMRLGNIFRDGKKLRGPLNGVKKKISCDAPCARNFQ